MAHQGFDIGVYPGDRVVEAWLAADDCPFEFIGYYLKANGHTNASWLGKRAFLKSLGWGIALIYFAKDDDGTTDFAIGTADGLDAITKTRAEGFPAGTIVFFDAEGGNAFSNAFNAYYKGWVTALLTDGTYKPGTYCSREPSNGLHLAGEQAFADFGLQSGAPTFWVAGGPTPTDPATAAPTDCGRAFASVWQWRLDTNATFAGIRLKIDFDIASTANPSNG